MTAIFWLISQEARVALANYQWGYYKTKLDDIDEPPAEGHKPELEPEPDPELTKLMKQPPSAEGRGDY